MKLIIKAFSLSLLKKKPGIDSLGRALCGMWMSVFCKVQQTRWTAFAELYRRHSVYPHSTQCSSKAVHPLLFFFSNDKERLYHQLHHDFPNM
jgi:hypothetical protein